MAHAMHGQDKYFEQQKSFFNSGGVNAERPLSVYMRIFQISHRDIKRLLNNKKLLLIGGGHSQIQRALDFAKINCDVTNVDPYINDSRSARTVINCDFNDTSFENEFDEVWALYSLPLYSPDLKHAAKFYRRAVVSLKPGGTLRIGGHPRWVPGILMAPIHFPRDKVNFEILDVFFNADTFSEQYTILPTHMYTKHPKLIRDEICHWEKWSAPANAAIKQALNEHIKQLEYKKGYIR